MCSVGGGEGGEEGGEGGEVRVVAGVAVVWCQRMVSLATRKRPGMRRASPWMPPLKLPLRVARRPQAMMPGFMNWSEVPRSMPKAW